MTSQSEAVELLVRCAAHGHWLVSASVNGTRWSDDRANAKRYPDEQAAEAAARSSRWLDHDPVVEPL